MHATLFQLEGLPCLEISLRHYFKSVSSVETDPHTLHTTASHDLRTGHINSAAFMHSGEASTLLAALGGGSGWLASLDEPTEAGDVPLRHP